jgi:uncharacterized repeat protein (TIGR03803 family)
LNISGARLGFGPARLAAPAIRGVLVLAVLFALLPMAARPAQAQTETVLYNFTGFSDGGTPNSRLTSDGAGNFYGTTYSGGLGYGTVFQLSPNGSGGWNETVLHTFTGGADGALPTYSYVIFDNLGNLYGTAFQGGGGCAPFGCGVVFELSHGGTSWTENVLYSFADYPDGANPVNGLIMDIAGHLYGTTNSGGSGNGTVFELSPSDGGWTAQAIAAVGSAYAGLTMDAAGNIFGASTSSTVFELSPTGPGGWTSTVIHTFTGAPADGYQPQGSLVLDNAGNLYGSTLTGGATKKGTIYELSPGESGAWTEKILYSFKGGKKDGSDPWAGIVFDAAGNIYGTTQTGGAYGDGTVFELVAPVGTGSYKEKLLWSFNGTDGQVPFGSLVPDSAGNLYGTTYGGGSTGYGVVFEATVPATTTTTLTSSPNPSTYGQAVTFTAVVASVHGAPPDGETVSFKKGTTLLGTGTLSAGSASFTTSALPVAIMTFTAVYGGDPLFVGSTSNAVKQQVKKAVTTTALSSSSDPSTNGQAVTLTAVVTSSDGAPPDGETVSFKKGTTVLGTATLSAGSASFTTSALPVGTTTITAVYAGDSDLASSKSSAVKQVVE